MLQKVGIDDAARRVNDYPHQFSGGQKQRIVIAMALTLEPDVIIADEPTTALDVTVQAEILELLRDLRAEFNTAIVLITHNMGVVADLADRVAVMYNGELVETAPVRELFASPKHEYTKKLLAAVPRLDIADRPQVAAVATSRRSSSATDLVIEYPGRLGRKAFRAVDRVSFEIRPGEVLGPGRRERIGQDHDRPRDRRPHARSPAARCRCSAPRCSACASASSARTAKTSGSCSRIRRPASTRC